MSLQAVHLPPETKYFMLLGGEKKKTKMEPVDRYEI
jgi:hypothetical protein